MTISSDIGTPSNFLNLVSIGLVCCSFLLLTPGSGEENVSAPHFKVVCGLQDDLGLRLRVTGHVSTLGLAELRSEGAVGAAQEADNVLAPFK